MTHVLQVMTAEELERQLRGETSESRPSNNRPPPGAMGVQNGHPVSMAQYNVPPPTMVGSPHSRNMVGVLIGLLKSYKPGNAIFYFYHILNFSSCQICFYIGLQNKKCTQQMILN